MHTLSIDIAARKGRMNCGVALQDPLQLEALDEPASDLIWTRSIDATELRTIAALIAEVHAELKAPFLLVLERQFADRASPNPDVQEKLLRTRMRFEVVAEIRGVATSLVWPASWQKILKILGDETPTKLSRVRKPKVAKAKKGAPIVEPPPAKAPRAIRDTKAAAALLAARLYPGAELGPDECDAVLMGRYEGWQRRTAA